MKTKTGICKCGHDESWHNGYNTSCCAAITKDGWNCMCLQFILKGKESAMSPQDEKMHSERGMSNPAAAPLQPLSDNPAAIEAAAKAYDTVMAKGISHDGNVRKRAMGCALKAAEKAEGRK